MLKISIKLIVVALVAGWITAGPMLTTVYAELLSPEQLRVIDSGVRYFDVADTEAKCSASGTAEAGSGGPASLKVDASFNLGTDPKERRVNLMKALMADYPGLTPEQAAGPVGNFMAESGGAHIPPDINEGDTAGAPPKFKGGYGWAQWTGGRQKFFIKFAVENGFMESDKDRATDGANYAYFKKELNESYKTTIPELKKTTSPEDAAVSFEATFENAGIKRLDDRKRNARQAFDEYGESSPGGAVAVAPECAVANNAALVGDTAFPLITTKRGISNPKMFAGGTASQGGHPYIAYDISTSPGTPVAAFMSGKVVQIGSDRCPGRLISVYNKESNLTISYLHLDFNNHVGLNEEVLVGQQIGLVGPAPNGCGVVHLHIDAVKGDKRVGCSRLSCSSVNKAAFTDIGPQLFITFQALAD